MADTMEDLRRFMDNVLKALQEFHAIQQEQDARIKEIEGRLGI